MPDDDELRYLVDNYKPANEVLVALGDVKLLAVVGPSAVGKTSIMELACKKSPLLAIAGNVTSREPRPNEYQNRKIVFTSKERMVDFINRKLLVQVAMMPTGELYASQVSDYPLERVVLKEIMSSVIPGFQKLFPSMHTAFVVPASYDLWMQWLDFRQLPEAEKAKRMEEAKTSLEFGLSSKGISFILNDELDQAADRLIQVAEGTRPDDEEQARSLIKDYYDKLEELLNTSSN